jgi:hypothetical protein
MYLSEINHLRRSDPVPAPTCLNCLKALLSKGPTLSVCVLEKMRKKRLRVNKRLRVSRLQKKITSIRYRGGRNDLPSHCLNK